MLTTLKSFYARICVALVAAVWVALLLYYAAGYSPLSNANMSVQTGVAIAGAVLSLLAFGYCWRYCEFLNDAQLVNTNRVTIGIFLLTLALVAFPGTAVLPFVLMLASGNNSFGHLLWLVLLGFPVFILLSVVGAALTFSQQRNRAA